MKATLIARFVLVLLLTLLSSFFPSAAGAAGAVVGTWGPTGSMTTARYYHTATLLPNGEVLITGGRNNNGDSLSSAELYNPTTGTWTATGSMTTARYDHTATLLPNGKVLVAGGVGPAATFLASAELYDPTIGTWTPTASMSVARAYHTATLLPNGKVLVAGGYNGSSGNASAELYDPASGTWSPTGSMNEAHLFHAATLLPNGQVLVAGGQNGQGSVLQDAELYDPATGTWRFTGSMTVARDFHTATLLPTGKVLVAGGAGSPAIPFQSAELYDPGQGTWSATGSMTIARAEHTATLLPNGQVLVAGGCTAYTCPITGSAELYDPRSGAWTTTGSMVIPRYLYTATLLNTGQVLVAGGGTASISPISSSELYTAADSDLGLTTMPANVTTNATSPQGAVVTYTLPAVVDEESPLLSVACTPTSGSTFPVGTTPVTCTVTDSDDTTSPVSQTFMVTVTPVLTASGMNVSATEGSAFSGVVATGVAYGTRTLSATITWGDGRSTAGTVAIAVDGSYSVMGSHNYAEEGSFPLTVTVSASGGLSATGTASAAVADTALVANTPTVFIKGKAAALLMPFTDADPSGTVSDYQATIDWGDGANSAGTIGTNPFGSGFLAVGAHTYGQHGTYTVTVTIKDAGGSSITRTLAITSPDLTLSNPNVFYEVGVLHAARPRSTIVMYAKGSRLPFDLSPMRAILYELRDGKLPDDSIAPLIAILKESIERAKSGQLPRARRDLPGMGGGPPASVPAHGGNARSPSTGPRAWSR